MSACSAMGKANALDAERQEPRNKILVELISFRIVQKRIRQKRRLLGELRLKYPPANHLVNYFQTLSFCARTRCLRGDQDTPSPQQRNMWCRNCIVIMPVSTLGASVFVSQSKTYIVASAWPSLVDDSEVERWKFQISPKHKLLNKTAI